MSEQLDPFRSPSAEPVLPETGVPPVSAEETILLVPPTKESPFRPSVWEAYQSVIRGEDAFPTLLIGGLFLLASGFIPVLPQILYWGFLCYEAERRIRFPERRQLSFNFDFFSKYLGRGVWAFLVQLVAGLAAGAIASLVLLPVLAGGSLGIGLLASGNEAAGAVGMLVGIPIFVVISFVVGLVMNAIVGLMYFRAGMSGSFAEGFRIPWVLDTLRKYWRMLLVDMLVWGVLGLGLSLVGLLVFCIGVYVAQAWAILALMHYLTQFYRLTLAEGAEPFVIQRKVALEGLEA